MNVPDSRVTVPPGARSVVKICYVVEDARSAALEWVRRHGAGPFFHHAHYAVQPFDDPEMVFDHSSAFGQWGEVMVELMQVHELRPDRVRDAFLVRPGIHHVTWFAPNLAEESARLEALGWPVLLSPTTTSGTTFTYHDARKDLGHLVLLYERRESNAAHYARVRAAAEGWDGSDPIREF